MAGFNISSLFNSSKSSGLSSINFTDYALIKRGSYGKLMKAYYAKDKDTSKKTDNTDKTTKKKTVDKVDATGLSKMKLESDGLKKAADALNQTDLWKETDGKFDQDKVLSSVKKFADEYNDVVGQLSKVSSKDVVRQAGYMTSMTKTMSKALSKVGVSVSADGKLSVDENKFKKADAKDIKALFSGTHSYAAQMSDKAAAISSAAVKDSNMYSSNGTFSDTVSSMFNKWV